ncbi:hypothetical protein NGF27_005579, partial [Salmonella enterica subsp. enterica]|nr:hypothetical protein [Salmonella enterica subsp. enterica]
MSSMTTEVKAAASVIPMVVTEPVKEPEVFQRTRSEFNRWLQAQFDNHYHTMRNGG